LNAAVVVHERMTYLIRELGSKPRPDYPMCTVYTWGPIFKKS